MFSMASAFVFPWDMHPGNDGQSATKPLYAKSYWRVMKIFMFLFYLFLFFDSIELFG